MNANNASYADFLEEEKDLSNEKFMF